MPQITLTIGFIPDDWSSASDDSKTIMVGDTDHSRTKEYEYVIGDDSFKNSTTGASLEGDMDAVCSSIFTDSGVLSGGASRLKPYLMKNIYEVCLEETGDIDVDIDLFEEGISQFENKRKKYNGCFYYRYIIEDEGEIAKELLFVTKKSSGPALNSTNGH